MIEIITQPKQVIADFVRNKQNLSHEFDWGRYTALGLFRDSKIVAGVIYNNYSNSNIGLHAGAIEGKRWGTPEFLFAVFDYPFNELDVRRVTAPCTGRNVQAQRFLENLGFEKEGILKHYYYNDDLLIYGMLKEHCRFIRRAAHGYR